MLKEPSPINTSLKPSPLMSWYPKTIWCGKLMLPSTLNLLTCSGVRYARAVGCIGAVTAPATVESAPMHTALNLRPGAECQTACAFSSVVHSVAHRIQY